MSIDYNVSDNDSLDFMQCFSHEAQSFYSIMIITSVYSAQFPLPVEHSLPLAAYDTLYNGAGKFKQSHLSHLTGSQFIHLRREQQYG